MDTNELINNADDAYYAAKYDEAIQLYTQILDLEADNQHALQQLEKSKRLQSADDAYYATEYEKAVQFYMQVLDLEPTNRHAREQLEKAELYQLPRKPKTELPRKAVQLYKRSRSFISAGDLEQASQLLKQAISIAKDVNMVFQEARELLGNLESARKAEEFKKTAFEELDTQQWVKALSHLNSAYNLDPTDDTDQIQILITHLQSLLKARSLAKQLMAGIDDRKERLKISKEVRDIIKQTSQTIQLSVLRLEVVELFRDCSDQRETYKRIVRNIIWGLLISVTILILVFSFLFLYPRATYTLDCNSRINGLEVKLSHPLYIANGDEGKIDITLTNMSEEDINGSAIVALKGDTRIPSDLSNVFNFAKLIPGEQKSTTIHFELFAPAKIVTNPRHHGEFDILINGNGANCMIEDFHIAASPIYGLHKVVNFLWGSVGVALTGLLWDSILERGVEPIKKFIRKFL